MTQISVSLRRTASRLFLLLCFSLSVPVLVSGLPLAAQSRGTQQRVVQGRVLDQSSHPVSGAVVYLKNDHDLSVKSFLSEKDGGYRFGQLSPNADYQIWAESNGKKSETKIISSFESRNTFNFDLTLK